MTDKAKSYRTIIMSAGAAVQSTIVPTIVRIGDRAELINLPIVNDAESAGEAARIIERAAFEMLTRPNGDAGAVAYSNGRASAALRLSLEEERRLSEHVVFGKPADLSDLPADDVPELDD